VRGTARRATQGFPTSHACKLAIPASARRTRSARRRSSRLTYGRACRRANARPWRRHVSPRLTAPTSWRRCPALFGWTARAWPFRATLVAFRATLMALRAARS